MKRLFTILTAAALLCSCVESSTELRSKAGEAPRLSVSKLRTVKQPLKGNFSGIAWVGGNEYVVVDDKAGSEGFYRFTIDIDSKGEITSVEKGEFVTNGMPDPDGESIEFYPAANSVFVMGERENSVVELSLADGSRTGRELSCADLFPVVFNAGLESLSYNEMTKRFWLTSETSLPDDGETATPENGLSNILRIQAYDENFNKAGQWFYYTDKPSIEVSGNPYVSGVSDICALDDGRLLVLERESNVDGLSVFCNNRIYIVNPGMTDEGSELEKELLIDLPTKSTNYANYEGLCLGPRLNDGSRILVLVSDSQANYHGLLKDCFLTIRVRGI
ncbi:MAG: esterase-like activity of phytase family protein [Bacteroidales bacterium]|nr:esterase-like activity of phytase family protein [Bacteroidales bacterium]